MGRTFVPTCTQPNITPLSFKITWYFRSHGFKMDPLKRKKNDKVGWQKRQLVCEGIISGLSLLISLQHSGSAFQTGDWEEREKDMEEIKHFDHEHPLSLRKGPDWLHCTACLFNWNDGQTLYICSEGCSYAQHQSCEMLSASQELQSLFHPPHTLTIHRQLRDDINLMCDACREEYCDFTRLIFRYDECNFQLDMCREFNQNPNT